MKTVAVTVYPEDHERLLGLIGKGNFSTWVRDRMKEYVSMNTGKIEDFDVELAQAKRNREVVKRDKINAKIRLYDQQIDNYKRKVMHLQEKKIAEEREKALAMIKCKKCGVEITGDNKSNFPGLCKHCYMNMDGEDFSKYRIEGDK